MKMSGQLHIIVSGCKLSLTSLSLSFNFAISKYAANFFFFLSLRRDWFDLSGFITVSANAIAPCNNHTSCQLVT